MKPTQPWSMARVASRRQLPKPRKMHGPVGERMDTINDVEGVHARSRAGKQCFYGTEDGKNAVTACSDCGYHVCSCKPVDELMLRGRRIVAREGVSNDEAFVYDDRIEVSTKTKDSLRREIDEQHRLQQAPYMETPKLSVARGEATDSANVPTERLTPGKLMRRECGSCSNTVAPGWNYCTTCIEMFGVNANPAIIPKWRDARPGSVDVAGLEKLRSEWQENHQRHIDEHNKAALELYRQMVSSDKDREQRPCGLCLSSEHKSLQCPEMARLYRERLGPL